MTLVRTGEPAAEPVTLAEVKNHLRIAHDSENDLLQGLIRAAREDLERATGMALIDQTWRLVLDGWPLEGRALLARHPVKAVTSVTAFGSEGEARLIDPGSYQVDTLSRPARIHFDIRPEPLRVMLLAAHWYEFRASFGAADQPLSYPGSYERIVARYRLRRL